MNAVLNISAYRFVPIDDGPALRDTLQARALALDLKGTVLVATEGINLFLAGPAEAVRDFVQQLQQDGRFAGLEPKESWSARQPFRKMQVKCKREIIRMNHPAIQPAQGRAPAVDAPTLKRWLDQGHDDSGRPVALLDTRNAFEVDHGTFTNAIDWRISKFSEFPEALQANASALREHTVVSFCTGGIRCEKAALLMREQGLEQVYQLEGGILKYFELAGGAHYQGSCFVFDEREALTDALGATKD
ncbi:MAG TPA: sulfurtransferase [Burkholderiaceae bacterium]